MPFVTPTEIFARLPKEQKCAVGAFNAHNMEYAEGIVKAAELEKAPVIMMMSEASLQYAGMEMLTNICLTVAKASSVPVAVTLDHGKSPECIDYCLAHGISVMVDGSGFPFEENVAFTRTIVERAHKAGLSVEGELGSLTGTEDGEEERAAKLTNPEEALQFAKLTGVDALAISIGNCHGLYVGTPKIEIDRLKKVKALVGELPVVMHGGSDLPVDVSKAAIAEGIRKFNVGTDLKYAFSNQLRETLNQEPMPFQPWDNLSAARDAVCRLTRAKITLFGSNGTAW